MVRFEGVGESGCAELARVRAALADRGPDGEGEWLSKDGQAALGHRRLAILDLSAAARQPMTSADGRFTIVFNGEIYDFRHHRAELRAAGVTFRSESDTEVLLELWRREGAASLARLRGMFALAIWDDERRELSLARDPYGIKPLYYAHHGRTLRFASQVKAIVAGGLVPRAIDPEAVAGFLSWGAVPEPRTIEREVRALPAGHLGRFGQDGRLRIEPMPRARYGYEGPPLAPEIALDECVAAHLVSDVPVAIFLSAGIDSALIASLARRRSAARPVALTLSWDEVRGSPADEAPLAGKVAQSLGLRHVVRRISGAELREAMPDILRAMDQPSIDGFNTWLVARLAREEGFKVALSGLGGDEILGGYSSFRDVPRLHRWARRLARLPAGSLVWSAVTSGQVAERPKLAHVPRYGTSWAGAYVLRRGLFLPHEVEEILGPGVSEYDAVHDAWQALETSVLGDSTALLDDPWRVVQRLESTIYLRNQLLRDADWAGMAHGVEIRVPFVDARLLRAFEAARFEPARGRGKQAFPRICGVDLPPPVLSRPKSGFQLPIVEWWGGESAPSSQGLRSRRLASSILSAWGADPAKARAA